MRTPAIVSGFLLSTLLCSCGSAPFRQKITLEAAVDQTVAALKDAYDKSQQYGGTWGLGPEEVTITYNISNETTASGKLTVGASYPPVTIGSELGLSKKSVNGNCVIIKFTRLPPKPPAAPAHKKGKEGGAHEGDKSDANKAKDKDKEKEDE